MNLRQIFPLLTTLLLVPFGVGCTSYRATILQRMPGNFFCYNMPQSHTRGLPVKLKVPTHVDVVVEEEFFIEKSKDEKGNLIGFFEIPLIDAENNAIHLTSVATKVIYTEKVFTVDFNRPAGGVLDVTSTFDSEQYFATITASYTERTLADINTALTTVKPLLGKASAARLDLSKKFVADKREVARARFDISECGWEERLNAFVDQYISGCYNDCAPAGLATLRASPSKEHR